MRRGIVISIIGLALAFGTFYVFSWPSSLSGKLGDEVGFNATKPEELLHTGLFLFTVRGPRDIKITTVKLNDSSPGLVLVASRLGGGGAAGALTGERPEIDRLPSAPGAILHPNDAGAFVITFRALNPGRYGFNGITVTYQTGWLTRTVKLGPRVTVRVPETASTPSPSPS
jgi:hypothetical protein